MESLTTFIGLIGVATVLFAYGMMTAGKWRPDSARYQWLNVWGTAGILISLVNAWNLPAFIANAAWILIGLLSLARIYRRKTTTLRGRDAGFSKHSHEDRPKQSIFTYPKWIASLRARNDGAK